MTINEAFLVFIPILAGLMKSRERPAALIYVLMAYLSYFILKQSPEPYCYFFSTATDVILVMLLVCLRWCSRSILANWLIPTSLIYIFIDFHGWASYKNGADITIYNSMVYVYYSIIIALFICGIFGHGDNNKHSRFLRGNMGGSVAVGEKAK